MLCAVRCAKSDPPPLPKHGLVQARRPRVTVVLMVFSDRGFYGQKFNAWWLCADCRGKERLGPVCDGFSCSQQHSDWYCNPMLSVFLISRSTILRMRSLILILNLIMIVALILTQSSSLLTIHRLAQILGRTMNCSLYGPKQGPSYFFPRSVASVG